MTGFPIRINWLPTSRRATIDVAEAVERAGFDGLGVTDTPRGIELYTAVEAALTATTHLAVGPNVTNASTRPWHVHVAAIRAMQEHGSRIFVGFGTGDSAVRAHGGQPTGVEDLRTCLRHIRREISGPPPLLVAASGPRAGRLAVDVADGIVAGVGTSGTALKNILGGSLALPERWATLRIAVADRQDDVARLRELVLPRAISAARFALASTFEGKDIPPQFHGALREGFRRYDFRAHGVAGRTANAELFAQRPDIEDFLLDRFAIVGTGPEVRDRLRRLQEIGFTGAYLSILFEEPLAAIERLAAAVRPHCTD